MALGIPLYFLLQNTGEGNCLICSLRVEVSHSSLSFFPPHTGIWWSYPCPHQFQSPSFSAPSQGFWMCACSSHTFSFCLEGESFRLSSAGGAELRLGVLLCWEMLTATVPGLWWKDNYRPDWWLLDALIRCQGFMCPALPPSHFLQDQKGTAYGCLKTFPKILELVGCDVQKPSALHLNKVMPSSWWHGLENLADTFPNGEHHWFVLVKFHTKSWHSCSPLGHCLGSSCSQWLIQSVGLGAEYIGTWVFVKFRVLHLLCDGYKGSLSIQNALPS